MYEIIKFSYKEFLRQTVNCELDVDSTCSILEQVDWVIFGKQIVLKSEMENAPDTCSERIQPADT